MKFRYIVTLSVGILFFLLIGNSLLSNHSILSNSQNKKEAIKIEKVSWQLSSKKNVQEVKISSKTMSVAQRDKLRLFITSDELNKYKIIELVYKGNNRYEFKNTFKKKSTYYLNIFLNDQTVDSHLFQKKEDQVPDLFPTSILTKKNKNYEVSLLFMPLQPNKKSKITFDFKNFKSHNPKMSNHQMYIVSDDGTYFKMVTNSSEKNKLKYELNLPHAGMYKLFYEFKLNNKNQAFTYIIDVKEKVN
jgi:hypothetical protein